MIKEIIKRMTGFLVIIGIIFFCLRIGWADDVTLEDEANDTKQSKPLFFSEENYEIAIIGEVNDTHQIVADNQIYEVAENKLGDELVYNYISARVKVMGSITEKDDMKIITVMSFNVMPE